MPNGTRGGRMLLAWPITKANLLKTPAKWPRYLFRRWGRAQTCDLNYDWIACEYGYYIYHVILKLNWAAWNANFGYNQKAFSVNLLNYGNRNCTKRILHIYTLFASQTYVNVLQITNWVDYSNGIYIHSSNYKANGMH